jgi:hypothetical protein
MIKEIVYTKTKREMPCQFNKLAINTAWNICFKNHRQNDDFIGNYRIRLSENVGFSWDPIGSCGVASTWASSIQSSSSTTSVAKVLIVSFVIFSKT